MGGDIVGGFLGVASEVSLGGSGMSSCVEVCRTGLGGDEAIVAMGTPCGHGRDRGGGREGPGRWTIGWKGLNI